MISEIYDATSENSPNTADYVILKTTQYMEENYASKITVDQLSKIVNMSTPNFFRYFKKVFNTSPMEYLKKIRISHATNMLSTTDKSISFIAQECGFFRFLALYARFRAVYEYETQASSPKISPRLLRLIVYFNFNFSKNFAPIFQIFKYCSK